MTNKEYRNHPAISRSELWNMRKSPFHFKYAQEHPEEDTAALLFGRALHKLILELDDFSKEFAIAPTVDRRTKTGKEVYSEFLLSSSGKDVISADDYQIMQDMAEQIRNHKIASMLLDGVHEESYIWVDDMTGEACKCRPDCKTTYNGEVYLVDYKTTDSCADGDFERSARKYGYDLQAGMYTEGVFANTLVPCGFKFIAQEKKPPYAVRIFDCTEEFIQQGVDKFREYIGMYHHCKTTGNWYGYEGPENLETGLFGRGE